MTNDVHAVLRDATRGLHLQTEAAFKAFDLRDRCGYRAFLIAQAGAVLPLEAWLDRQGIVADLPDWPSRCRTPLLQADLAALGVSGEGWAPARSDIAGDPVGVAYVLEGSRLGARILARRVGASPDPLVAQAVRFLTAPRDPAGWQALLDLIGTRARSPARQQALVDGAVAAFALFQRSALDVAASEGRAGPLRLNETAPGRLA